MADLTITVDGAAVPVYLGDSTALASERANAAAASASAAQTSASAALLAEQAARAAANLYATSAAGLAATVNGQYFNVMGANDEWVIVYKNNAGVAQELKRVYLNVDIRQFGASTGAADNAAAILAAMSAGMNVYIPAGAYGCSANVLVAQMDGQRLYGPGSIVLNAALTGTLFKSGGFRVILDGVTFNGNGAAQNAVVASAADRNGIGLDFDKDSVLHNVRVLGFQNAGIYPINLASSRFANVIATGVTVRNCWLGVQIGPSLGEYSAWGECKVSGCRVGVEISSGNVSWTGGSVNDNARNFYILGTGVPNNGHGSITGTLINHADDEAILAVGITNGFSITGCQMFYGDLVLDTCKGIVVTGCTADLDAWRFGGLGYNRVFNNSIIGALLNTVQMNYGGVISPTELFENRKATGALLEQHQIPQVGQSVNVAGDQSLMFWWEIGSFGTDGWEITTNSGTGYLKVWKYSASVRGATPLLTWDRVNNRIGFFGATPAGVQSVGAAATDAATTQTLANNLRAALVAFGLATT